MSEEIKKEQVIQSSDFAVITDRFPVFLKDSILPVEPKERQDNLNARILFYKKILTFLSEKYPSALGIAANQLLFQGQPIIDRFFIYKNLDKQENKTSWKVAINPHITQLFGKRFVRPEYCLTWPNRVVEASRTLRIHIEFTDLAGNAISGEFRGLVAQIMQHEVGHLDGVEEQVLPRTSIMSGYDLPPIERNGKCPCGSGFKFKKCCHSYL